MTRATLAILVAALLGACRGEPAPPPPEAPPDTALALPSEADPTAQAADGSLPEEPGGEPGVPGSPAPQTSFRVPGGRCYVYAGWVAIVKPRDGVPGEDIVVAARPADSDAGTLCANPPAPAAAFTDRTLPSNFFGIVDDHLLVDAGTGARGRTLRVVDLATGAEVVRTTYEEPVSVDAGVLRFAEPVGGYTTLEGVVATGVNCPDAQAWLEQGFGVGVNRVVRFRFADASREAGPDLVCVPLE